MSLLAELQDLARGLVYLSESDAPVKAFHWRGVLVDSEAALRTALRLEPTVPIKVVGVETFFAPMTTPQAGDDDEARADQARFAALVAKLLTLKDPQVYRVGDGPELRAFAIGTSPGGDAAGVRTQLTET